mgnify:CR=1 FL=1
MPRLAPFLLAAVAAVFGAGPASAQRGYVVIENLRIGLPPGRYSGERDENQAATNVVKRDVWAPLYFSLKVEGELPPRAANARLVVDAVDADDLRTSISYPLGNFAARTPGELIPFGELASTPFVRFGDRNNGDVTVTVYAGTSKLSDPVRVQYLRTRDPSTYVVLSLGSRLPGFELPKDNQFGGGLQQNVARGGRVETAAITTLAELPDQWFGYAAADLIVLTTGSASNDFLTGLFSKDTSAENKAKLAALVEWVRRGGRLVVSVAGNAQMLTQFPAFQQLLPAKLNDNPATTATKDLKLDWAFGSNTLGATLSQSKKEPFPVSRVTLDPARPARTLVPKGKPTEPPAAIQAPLGLGRVTLVTFDLDRSPFTELPEKAMFWDYLLRDAGADKASTGSGKQTNYANSFNQNTEDEFVTALRNHVDTFDGVPVISFGWVALFIALYTLLIGPVEYLILKKVVGRLELTWISFPVIVVSVSAAAYFTAYAIKGNDLKINKVDVVDVDPASGRVYGRTWFTIFSPRIDSYTVGVEPREAWAGKPGEPTSPPLVDWLAGGQSGGGNIVSRGYSYHTDPTASPRRVADGLISVPIQVWSTKAFSANWTAPLDPASPLVESRLYHPRSDATALRGSFVNNLPVKELRDAVLVYGGRVYKLGTLVPGQQVAAVTDTSSLQPDWMSRELSLGSVGVPVQDTPGWGGRNRNTPAQSTTSSALNLWPVLFHEKALTSGSSPMNSALRPLDQSWRMSPEFTDQAILLAKVDGKTDPGSTNAEQLLTDPTGPSPTLLWLRGVPSGSDPRTPVPGTLRQETYIRVFLPVAATNPGK